MSFGSMFNSFVKNNAEDLLEQYGGKALGGNSELVGSLLGALSGKQELSVQNVVSMVQSGGAESLLQHAEQRGLDPALLNGVLGIINSTKSSDGQDGQDGGGGFDIGSVVKMIGGLTNKGTDGSGADGFMQLLQGAGGSGGDGATPVGNILQILVGLAKSYFNVKGKSNTNIQAWEAAGAGKNQNDGNFLNWALNLIRQLLFPGKKPKEIIEDGGDEEIDTDPDNGKKKDDGDVKGWYDGHPEIGKMQKDIFDDIFDTTDDGKTDEDDPSPIVPKPQDFEENCSCLDNAAILFINTNLLLEYRANWRFLFSTETHGRSLEEMASRICYQGPTILVVKDTEGNMFGAHASTSWCNTEGGWLGNGECFIFSIQPKMAVFHSTGKDENFQMLTEEHLAMGGKPGSFGLMLTSDLSQGSSTGHVDTFHTVQLTPDTTFDIEHVEVWGLGLQPDMAEEKEKAKPRKPNWDTRAGNIDLDDLESQFM